MRETKWFKPQNQPRLHSKKYIAYHMAGSTLKRQLLPPMRETRTTAKQLKRQAEIAEVCEIQVKETPVKSHKKA